MLRCPEFGRFSQPENHQAGARTLMHHALPPSGPAPAHAATRRNFLAGALVLGASLVVGPGSPMAEVDGAIAPEKALGRAKAGDLTIIDVRSPEEWRRYGMARGARGLTIHGPKGMRGFVDSILAEFGGDKTKPVALICATGIRSAMAYSALKQAGFENVKNIKEGMFGGPSGPGWQRRGLPVQRCPDCR